jgi:hypothetical protein
VIANIIAYLLEASEDRKIGDRIRKDDFPAEGHACRYPGHVLLGNAYIYEPIGKPLSEIFDDSKSQVPYD